MSSKTSHIRRRRYDAGFSLMELLMAMVILTIVTAVVYSAFTSVIVSSETAREAAERLHQRRYLTRNLETNLTRAYMGWLPGAMHRPFSDQETDVFVTQPMDTFPLYWFRGENGSASFGDADKLTFATSASIPGHTALPGHYKLVTMELVRELEDATDSASAPQEEADTLYLQVTEMPIMAYGEIGSTTRTNVADDSFITRLNEQLDVESPSWNMPMRTMNIRYYDGEEWQDAWDSLEEERLPWMVELVFEFPSETQEDVFTMDADTKNLNSFRLLIPIAGGMGIRDKTPEYGRPPPAA